MQTLQNTNRIDQAQNMHTYYDINMFNNDQVTGEPTNSLVYTESRNMPFLKSPSNYYCSIVRFSLQTATPAIPVFIPHIEIGQADPNKTIYQFYIYQIGPNTTTTQSVSYIPSDLTLTVKPPLVTQDLSNEYYFVYSYQYWVEMMNDALNALATTVGIASPYFIFDTDTSLLKLYVPQSWGATYLLGCNRRLYTLLDSFPSVINSFNIRYIYYRSTPVQKYYKPVTINAVNYYEISQESTSIGLLNPVTSVVFTTALLPINPSLTSPPQIFNSNTVLGSNGNNSNISPIITDFQVNLSNGNTYRNTIDYAPQAEYRLVDCLSDTPISAIEISVFWKDVYGILHPLRLASGCNCNLKLMFRRKNFNNVKFELQ